MRRLLGAVVGFLGSLGAGFASADTVISVTQVSYDALGRAECTALRMNPGTFGGLPPSACVPGTAGTDGPDRITFTEYDDAGQVKKITSGHGVMPQVDKEVVAYTDNGLEKIVADGKGNRTTYEYDDFDRLKKVRYPNAVCCDSSTSDFEEYGYDANGNRTSWRRRFEISPVIFTYDALNRATSGLRGEAYGYDNLGRRTSATFAGGSAGATYDALGRVKSETTNGRAMTYAYDPAGNRTGMTWPDTFAVTYDRDASGAITAVKQVQTPGATPVTLATYSYDDLGRTKSLERGNGLTSRYGYDAVSRLTCLSHAVDCALPGATWTFTYNAASQVKTRTANDTRYEWLGSHASKAYESNGLNQYAKIGAVTYRYGGRGNLTCEAVNVTSGACEGTSYGYDIVNNLTSVTASGAAKTLGYEPTGRLELISTTSVTRLLYGGSDLVAEYDGGGTLVRRYVPGPGTDAPIVWYEGAGVGDRRWLLADPQGSIVAATSGAGTAIVTNTYDEYGVPGPGNQGRFQYTGQAWIPEVGLYHYKARAYSPTLGRFLQTDPTGYDDGMNWYAYVGNDPINGTDPTGTERNRGRATPAGQANYWRGLGLAYYNISFRSNAPEQADGLPTPATTRQQAAWKQGYVMGGMVAHVGSNYGFGIWAGSIPRANSAAARITGPIAGGGAKLENLSAGEIARIQNAANRTGTAVTVVGSRANGTARASSDWDFVLPEDTPRTTRHSLTSSLPEGSRGLGEPRNQDFFRTPLDPTKPHIIFSPEPK